MTSMQLRALARHLERRVGAPSLEGYMLSDGLRAAADLLDGEPGPEVHSDCARDSDAFPPRVSLSELVESLDLECPHPEVDVRSPDDELGVCSSCRKVVPA